MRYLISLSTTLAILAGCGGDTTSSSPDAGSGPIAADAMAPGAAVVYAVGSDSNAAGILSRITLPDTTVTTNLVAGVASSDPVVRSFGGKLYLVNRFGADNVTIVDPVAGSLVAQISTGAGTNPQDVTVVGTSIYVCAFNSGDIIVLDESNPSATPKTIDISSYDDDGVPNCGSIAASGGKVYATLGLIDDTYTSHGGKVIVIDPKTDTVEADFDLTYKNPLGLLIATEPDSGFSGDLLVGTTEDFGTGNGCVERITTGLTPGSGGCLITNANLGGFATTINTRGDHLWIAVSTSFTEAKLIQVSSGGILDDRSLTPSDHLVTDFSVCPTGQIVTNDKNNGTVVVYDAEGQDITTPPLDIGLPPVYTNGIVCL